MTPKSDRLVAGLATALALTLIAGCSDSGSTSGSGAGAKGAGQHKPTGPTQVGVVTMQPQSAPKLTQLPGRVVALATADVRPQVNGIIQEIAFKEGGPVKAGDVLYKLDNKSYTAARNAAAAAVKKAEAGVASAQSTYDRTQTLVTSKTAAPQTLDDARSTLLQAQADQLAAQADLQAAQINLDYTDITAPIDGIISTSAASVGSLVTANQTTALATIRQMQPIYVDLVDSSANLLKIRQQVEQGRLGIAKTDGKVTPPKVNLTLETGQPYDEQGVISTADTAVSETTGTFSIRSTFPNQQHLLLPGMYVRATVDLGALNNVFLVSQRAVSRDASGAAIAYVVSADNKLEQRTLQTDGSTLNAWIVTSGVNAGDKVVVDGNQDISAGAAVTPVEAQINDQGVVEQQITPPAATGAAKNGAAQ